MRNRLLAACLSLSLAACGTEASGPALDESPRPTGTTADVQSALAALPAAHVLGAHDDGVPYMIRGELGSAGGPMKGLAAREAHARLGSALEAIAPVFRLRAADLMVQRLSRDEQGHQHLRFQQTGRPARGGRRARGARGRGGQCLRGQRLGPGWLARVRRAKLAPEAALKAAVEGSSARGAASQGGRGAGLRALRGQPGAAAGLRGAREGRARGHARRRPRLRGRAARRHPARQPAHPHGAQPQGVLGQQRLHHAGHAQAQRGPGAPSATPTWT